MNTQTNTNEIECPCGRIAKRASGDLPLCPACYAGEPDTISLALWSLRSGRRLGVRPAEVRLEMKATLRERRERMQGEHPSAERDEWIAAKIAEWC